jgi:uncharacterized membrane protein required for colicin V production
MFLVQWTVAFLVACVVMPGHWRGFALLAVATPAIIAAAAALARLHNRLVEPLRVRLRAGPLDWLAVPLAPAKPVD